MKYHKISKKGFTLAEVLITLGVVGVVAALTLPSVIAKYQERQMIIKLKQTFSIFSQAVELAQAKYGDINNWEATGDEQKQVDLYFERITSGLSLLEDCGNVSCYYFCKQAKYTNLSGQKTSVTPITHHAGILNNGVLFSVSWARPDNSKWWGKYAQIDLDINGKKGPNVLGKDVFSFEVREEDNWTTTYKPHLYPAGQLQYQTECFKNPGTICTHWAMTYENMDYLRCPEKLSLDGPYSCAEANKKP